MPYKELNRLYQKFLQNRAEECAKTNKPTTNNDPMHELIEVAERPDGTFVAMGPNEMTFVAETPSEALRGIADRFEEFYNEQYKD